MITWLRARRVRLRLTLLYTSVLAVTLVIYAVFIYAFLQHSISSELDRELLEDLETARHMFKRAEDGGVRLQNDARPDASETWTKGLVLQVFDEKGSLLYQSSPKTIPEAKTMKAPATIDGLPVTIQVSKSEHQMRQDLRYLMSVLALGIPVVLALAAAAGYFLAHRAMAPVEAMAERAKFITLERLSERLPVENPPDEFGRLATVFNNTFARLEGSVDRLRRFTSDASHELRTPLTAIRSVGEVALRGGENPNGCREAIGSMLEEVDRLARLVDCLLTLSRADAGQLKLAMQHCDLTEIARGVVEQLNVLAEEKQQRIVFEPSQCANVSVDRAVFRLAVMNVIDNAIKHSPAGATIRVGVKADGAVFSIEVTDTGPGISVEDAHRVFDRFFRVDEARTQTGGFGLGLSIAKWAVEANGGRIEVESGLGNGSTFRIVVPSIS